MKKYQNIVSYSLFVFLIGNTIISCENFVELDSPKGQLNQTDVFENNQTAQAAVNTLYALLRDNSLIDGNLSSAGFYMGIYSDELDSYAAPNSVADLFYRHQIIPTNSGVKEVWTSSYKVIYECNAVIEGVEKSKGLTNEQKKQYKAEAVFIRSLTYFYLTNLFGDIPFITTTDYTINQKSSKTKHQNILLKIEEDLIESKQQLSELTSVTSNLRANKYNVTALLARLYIYQEKWEKAESESTKLINSGKFQLENELNKEFLKESRSTLFQLKAKAEGGNSNEGSIYIFEAGPPPNASLSPQLFESFEPTDLRKQQWTKQITTNGKNWVMPFKYKEKYVTTTSKEYTIVFRLAEQVLIRAEARMRLGNLNGAKGDINSIRNRAGLTPITTSSSQDIFEAIVTERQHELFTEHGHRWFDLKRWKLADQVLSPIKTNWKATDVLLPIPEAELLINPNLLPQNQGY